MHHIMLRAMHLRVFYNMNSVSVDLDSSDDITVINVIPQKINYD